MEKRRNRLRPERLHGGLALLLAGLGTAALLLPFRQSLTGYHVLAAWLLAVNATAFGYFGYDKACANASSRRVPEVVLHGLTLLGGSPGAYVAMRFFRHKTIKGRFRFVFWCIVLLQLGLCIWIATHFWRRTA